MIRQKVVPVRVHGTIFGRVVVGIVVLRGITTCTGVVLSICATTGVVLFVYVILKKDGEGKGVLLVFIGGGHRPEGG